MKHPSILVAGALLGTAASAQAHVVSFEPQEKLPQPQLGSAADDYSVMAPRILDNIWGSKSIYGFLDADDADFFQFTLATGESRVLAAIPLTPACQQTKQNYVNIAVYGPGLPATDPAIPLPFSVPDGMGVLVKLNPVPPAGQERPIFYEPTSVTSAFLPVGATNTCIWTTPGACDWSNSLATSMPAVGTYMIVVWAQNKLAQEYSLSVGMIDTGYYVKSADEPLTYNNAYLHSACNQLLPDDRFFDGGAPTPIDASDFPSIDGGSFAPGDGGGPAPIDSAVSLSSDGGALGATDAGGSTTRPDAGCGCTLGGRAPRGLPWLLPGLALLLRRRR